LAAVDFTPSLDGHDAQSKIGIITSAVINGNAKIWLNVGESGFTSITVSASGFEKSGLSSNVYAKFSGGASIARRTILEQMHGVRREQADRSERKTGKAEATCEPSERHHAGDDRPRGENDANLKCR
jgi:hypothetical protein